jgi:hypothetical protein
VSDKPKRAPANPSELDQFAAEFPTEARLRDVVADLLRKMDNTGVLITHSATEKGKDIVFYETGGMRALRLCACVVKNGRITGVAGASSGAGTVMDQARRALSEPYVNPVSGEQERVSMVYIISPYNCTPGAVESIRGQLMEKAGQISFICGEALLQRFRDHWMDFLRFETGLLSRYLASHRMELEQDRALTWLLARQNIGDRSRTLSSIYVRQRLEQELHSYEVADLTPLQSSDLSRTLRARDVQDLQVRLRLWGGVLAVASMWADIDVGG